MHDLLCPLFWRSQRCFRSRSILPVEAVAQLYCLSAMSDRLGWSCCCRNKPLTHSLSTRTGALKEWKIAVYVYMCVREGQNRGGIVVPVSLRTPPPKCAELNLTSFNSSCSNCCIRDVRAARVKRWSHKMWTPYWLDLIARFPVSRVHVGVTCHRHHRHRLRRRSRLSFLKCVCVRVYE